MIFYIIFLLYSDQSEGNVCPTEYKPCGSLCFHYDDQTSSFCEASEKCYSINGRLVVEKEIALIRSCLKDSAAFILGITDLFNERYTNRKGWINTDGSVFTNTNLWRLGEPSDANGREDCTQSFFIGINDFSCDDKYPFVCLSVNWTTANSKHFKIDINNIYNNDNEVGCYREMNSKSKLHCGTLCLQEHNCKSFFYNSNRKRCVLAKYAKSTLPASWKNDEDIWLGYHSV